jgi:iron complex transport system substrate-binding protein
MASSRSLRWWVLLAFVAGVAALRWAQTSSPPPKENSRVLLFAPNLNEAAVVLGYGDRIAGVTDYCIWPDSLLSRPRIGGILNPNLERILSLDPGLLVLQGQNTTLRNFARREGIAVANVDMDRDLAAIFAGLLRLDAVLGGKESTRGATVVDSLRQRLEAWHSPETRDTRPTVLLVLGHRAGSLQQLLVVGPGTYLQDLVGWVGGEPVPDDGSAYRSLSLEALVADPPDVALDLRPGSQAREADRREFEAAWRRLGIESTQVEIVDFAGVLVPGPRVDQTARALRQALLAALGNSR